MTNLIAGDILDSKSGVYLIGLDDGELIVVVTRQPLPSTYSEVRVVEPTTHSSCVSNPDEFQYIKQEIVRLEAIRVMIQADNFAGDILRGVILEAKAGYSHTNKHWYRMVSEDEIRREISKQLQQRLDNLVIQNLLRGNKDAQS